MMSCDKCQGLAGYCEGCMSQGTIPTGRAPDRISIGDLVQVGPGLESHPIQAHVLSCNATLIEVGWPRLVAGELTFMRGLTARDGVTVLSHYRLGPEQQEQFSRRYGRGLGISQSHLQATTATRAPSPSKEVGYP